MHTVDPVPVRVTRPVMPVLASAVLATAAFLLSTHHAGWLFNSLSASSVFPLLLGAVIIPVVMLLVASINMTFLRWMFVLAFIIFEISCYIILIALPNPVNPRLVLLDPLMLFLAFLNAGASAVLVMVAFTWLGAVSRAGATWPVVPGLAIAGGGVLASILVPLGVNGWLVLPAIGGVLIAVAVAVRFAFLRPGTEATLAGLIAPSSLATTVVQDSAKVFKLVMVAVALVLFMAVSSGLAGIGGSAFFLVGEHALFYTGFVIGAPVASLLAFAFSRSFPSGSDGPARLAWSQRVMLLAIAFVAGTGIPIFAVDVFVPGVHGSAGAQVMLGMVFSIAMTCHILVALTFHPPRGFTPHVMLLVLLVLVAAILGGVIEAIYITGDPVAEIAGYFDIVAATLLVVVAPVILACTVTWCKTRAGGGRQRA